MSYLVDTDWVIDHLHDVVRVSDRLAELAPDGLAISIISLAELYEGVIYSGNPEGNERTLLDFLGGIPLIMLDDETCRIFGRERGRLRRAGRMIGDFDLMIAATSLRHNLTLLTNNRRHFEQVEGLTIISACSTEILAASREAHPMPMTLTINDQPVTVPEGSSVLDAVNFSGITITPS